MSAVRASIALFSLSLAACATADAERDATVAAFSAHSHFRFLNRAEAEDFLGTPDAFTRALSPADLLLRFDDAKADYLSRAPREARDWTPAQIALTTQAIELTRAKFKERGVALPLPAEVALILTTGAEEGSAGNYTRRNAIIVQEEQMQRSPEALIGVVTHELFHVATRHQPSIRTPLYSIIGFKPCGALAFPAALRDRKITNPDAFHFDYCISVAHAGESFLATPITILGDVKEGQESIFDSIDVRLLAVTQNGVPRLRADGGLTDYALDDVSGFFEQVGGNTDYILHPEEILADNFSLLVRGVSGVPNPQILAHILETLASTP